jgi:hypothetical protein
MSPQEEMMVEHMFLKFNSEKIEGKLVYVNEIGFINFLLEDNEWIIAEGFPEKDFLIAQMKLFFPLYYKRNKEKKIKEIERLIKWSNNVEVIDIAKLVDLAILEILQGIYDFGEITEEKDSYSFPFLSYDFPFYIRKIDFKIFTKI